jgi:hypothetical protein
MSSPGETSGPSVGTTAPRFSIADRLKALFDTAYFKTLHFVIRVVLIVSDLSLIHGTRLFKASFEIKKDN